MSRLQTQYITYKLPHSQIYNNMELINTRYVETADAVHNLQATTFTNIQ